MAIEKIKILGAVLVACSSKIGEQDFDFFYDYGCRLNRLSWPRGSVPNSLFCVFSPFLSLHQTAWQWQSYRLSHIDTLCINQFYYPKDQSVKFWRKLLSFWGWLKNSVFLSRPFWIFFFKKKKIFLLHSYSN